jgi:hypothetical protein
VKVQERATEIKGIIYSHCVEIIETASPVDVNRSKRYQDYGTISAEFICTNDSSINIFETIKEGNVEKYSYEYSHPDTGFFFHYQNDGYKNGIRKPLHHLHVGIRKNANKKLLELLPYELIEHNGPHYKVQEITINEFMGVIIENYFEKDKNHDEILERLGF